MRTFIKGLFFTIGIFVFAGIANAEGGNGTSAGGIISAPDKKADIRVVSQPGPNLSKGVAPIIRVQVAY